MTETDFTLIYLDTNVYSRPFDDQTRIGIEEEANALHVASAVFGDARYFLSCDQKVTQKKQARCYRRFAHSQRDVYFSVMNPTRFVEKMHKGELK